MGESTDKTQKKSWFKGLKAEFKKVVWPDKNALAKQTIAVVSGSVLVGAIITIVDILVKYGIDIWVNL